MKITDVKVYGVSIPLRKPFKTALRVVNVLETNIIEIGTDTGEIGFGEASPTAVITGDTRGSIREAIEEYIFPAIKGMDIEDIENIMLKINKSMIKNSSPKAAVDMAIYDLFGKHYKMPLYKFFGGAKKEFETDITISVNDPETMAKHAIEYTSEGYNTLKLKVGIDSDLDIKRVKAIRDAIGPNVKIRLDANQGWSFDDAKNALVQLAEYDIEFCEQPMRTYNDGFLPELMKASPIKIMADESVYNHHDALRLIKSNACDFINIKFAKSGGINEALKILAVAKLHNIPCMMGGMLESRFALTTFAHFAAANPQIIFYDMDTCMLGHKVDPVIEGVTYNGFNVQLPNGIGIGAEVQEDFLKGCEMVIV